MPASPPGLDDGQGERVALIAANLHAGTRYITERLAERTAALGLHVSRLFLAGTHNHSEPGNFYANTSYDTFAQAEPLLKEQGLDALMVDYLVERLGLGVREACARLRPHRTRGDADPRRCHPARGGSRRRRGRGAGRGGLQAQGHG